MDEARAAVVAECLDHLPRLAAAVESGKDGACDAESVNDAAETIRAIRQQCASANFAGPESLLRPLHAILHGIQNKRIAADEATDELLPEAVAELRNWLETIEATNEDPPQKPVALIERLDRLAESVGLEDDDVPPHEAPATVEDTTTTGAPAPRPDSAEGRFLRVRAESLDELLSLLGRLSDGESSAQQGTVSDLQQCIINMRVRPAETPSAFDAGRCDIGPDNPEGVTCSSIPRRRALVVGDSIFGRRLMATMLETTGCEAAVAEDADRAVEAVAADGARYDVLVLEIGGQTAETIEMIGQIRNCPAVRGMPLLGVSLKDKLADEARFLRAGVDRCLAGPDTRLLSDAVEDLCRQSRLRVGASA